MDEKGVGGIVLHARHGLLTPYMSKEWFQMLDCAIEECDRRGMIVWLYDEDNWPSGTYGGKLTREHEEYRMRYLRVEEIKIGSTVHRFDKDDNTLIAAYACKLKADKAITSQVDITDCISDEVHLSQFEGYDIVLIFWECPVAAKVTYCNGYYLDTMNEEAVQAFLELSYEPYNRYSKHFGKTIQGVFTDEPGLMIHDGFFGTKAMRTSVEDIDKNLPGHVLAWTRDIFHKFKKLKGYDLKEKLPSLLYDTGEGSKKVREDYYDAITTWYVTHYHKALGDWCRERDLKYIGHTLEDPLWGQARSQGNQTNVLQQFDYPGLDYLGSGVGTKDNPNRILALKCASSVADVEGRARVVCEAFGGSGHGHRLRDRQLDANFMAVLGVNLYIPHGFFYSFAGYRKTDWPPTEFYHAPFWSYYKEFADYLGRLSLIAASGEYMANIGILSPIHTAYQGMFKNGEAIEDLQCDKIYAFVSDRLLRYHRSYHYIDESQLKVDGGKLIVGKRTSGYKVLVLPGTDIILEETALILNEFISSGGSMIIIGEAPSILTWDEVKNNEFQAFLRGSDNVIQLAFDECIEGSFYEAINESAPPQLAITHQGDGASEDVIVAERTLNAGSLYLLVNRRQEEVKVEVEFPSDALYEWDLETGQIFQANGGKVLLKLDPAQAKVFSTGHKGEISDNARKVRGKVSEEISLVSKAWSFKALEGNVLPLDKWDVTIDTKQMVPGQANIWTSQFTIRYIPDSLKLVLDTPDQWIPSHVGFLSRQRATEVYINGAKLPPLRSSSWQDKYYLEQDIGDYLRCGDNKVEIETLSLLNPIHSVGHPAYIVGDFSLQDKVICKANNEFLGYWTDHGYPYFSGIGIYSVSFDLSKIKNHRYVLKAGSVDDGMAIRVNGQLAGVRIWPPYEVDITDCLVNGANELNIEVFNSLENLYNRNPKNSGLRGRVVIVKHGDGSSATKLSM